jgi:hypothetical protein
MSASPLSASAALPATAGEETRARTVIYLQVAFALGGAFLSAATIWPLLLLAPETGARVVKLLATLIPFSDKIDKVLGPGSTETLAPQLIAFVGGGWVLWKGRSLVRWIVNHGSPTLDSELFRPISRPGAVDPLWLPALGADTEVQPLPWVTPPRDSPRGAVWVNLIKFLTKDVGDGRFNLLGRPKTPFDRFRWTMLSGEPGSGKTRMATEICRARARLELLGDDRAESKVARGRLAWGAWLRSVWPFARRREAAMPEQSEHAPWRDADPWDAWWILATSELKGIRHEKRNRFDTGLLDRLQGWRPRRPTVLLLDDPRSNDAGNVIGALLKSEARYRHPVRLIVVSQTLPQELELKLHSDGWVAGLRGFAEPVLSLDLGATVSPAEVRRMFGGLHLSGHFSGWKPTDDNVHRLLVRARGNALLVCLALRDIQRRPKVEVSSASELLLERAERIEEALQAAGVGTPEHLQAIAWATLAGGEGSDLELREELLDLWPKFDPANLQYVPNLRGAWSLPAPPMVRPEPIGDAFARLVLSNKRCDPLTRRRVIAAAWRANPAGMLSASRRLAARDDPLAAELRAGPPEDIGLEPLDLALAYALAATRIPRPEWDAREIPHQFRAVLAAMRRIRALPPDQAASGLGRFVDLLDVPHAVAVVRGRATLFLICLAILRGLQDESSWQDPSQANVARAQLIRIFELLRHWGTNPYRDLIRLPVSRVLGALAGRVVLSLGSPLAQSYADDLARAAWRAGFVGPGTTAVVLSHLYYGLLRSTSFSPLALARGNRLLAMAVTLLGGGHAARTLVDRIAHALPGDVGDCEHAATRVDDIARPFAGNREFELERAQAWRHVAYARGGDVVGCEHAATRVDDIARPFAGNREFELERAQAWRHVGYARRDEVVGCERAAAHVDDVARPFAGDREFELERAQAWGHVAYARRDDVAGCEYVATCVDDIIRHFAGDSGFELERAKAWGQVSYAYASRGDVAGCDSAATRVDGIVRRFAGDREFELRRAHAWVHVVWARRNDGTGCERVAAHVDQIARPFAGELLFELLRALTWLVVSCAHRGDDVRCEHAATQVDDIARPFAGDREFELKRALAWRFVAYARHGDVAGCEDAATQLDSIVRPLAGERVFERRKD